MTANDVTAALDADPTRRNWRLVLMLRPGMRVDLLGRQATVLSIDLRYWNVRVLVLKTGHEEDWWIGNLRWVPVTFEDHLMEFRRAWRAFVVAFARSIGLGRFVNLPKGDR
jgi:hypothetical protein